MRRRFSVAARRPFTLLFDKSCPLCAWEIGHYERSVERLDLTSQVRFRDVGLAPSAATLALMSANGLTADVCRNRMHAIREDGVVVRNTAAFIGLWEKLPYWSALAAFLRLPAVLPLSDALYERFLVLRATAVFSKLTGKKVCDADGSCST
jgi:predicted DCC family thiol-disulfide oxidoreductase YuxK